MTPIDDLHHPIVIRTGLDTKNVKRLAEVLDRCPPIVITASGGIIDGRHRVAAARQLGRHEIRARVVHLGEEDALAEAIRLNSGHGLPLTRKERRAAVTAVLSVDANRTDGAVAQICGVSVGLVSAVRAEFFCSGGQIDDLNGRVGRDGKCYGKLPADWPRDLEAHVRVWPDLTVRELSARTGAAVGTISTRRKELLARIEREGVIRGWLKWLWARWRLRRFQPRASASDSTSAPEPAMR